MQKKLLLAVIANFVCNVSFTQNLKMIDTTTSKKEVIKVIKYDSLNNIRPYKDISYYNQFIGQSILFYPRNPNSSKSLPEYYANFETPDSRIVLVDTIWFKKSSKPKPKDYKLKQVTSNRYKAQFMRNNYATLCAYPHDIYEEGYAVFPFEIYRVTNSPREKHTGIFTHYGDVEGKTFKILDIKHIDSYKRKTIFTLLSESRDTVFWNVKRGGYDGLNSSNEHYPVIVVGFMEKMKQLSLNKDIYIKSIHPISKYKCVDIVYSGSEDNYMVPSFVLKNDSTDLIMPLCESPSLFSYEISLFEWEKRKAQMYFYNLDVADAKSYEDTMEKERLILEKERLAEVEERKKERLAKVKALEKKRLAEAEVEKKTAIKKQQKAHRLYEKYGKTIADLLLEGIVRIGMTKEMVLESWGSPSGGVNRTIGEWGVSEQWVYGGRKYLYFENGKLTTIQD